MNREMLKEKDGRRRGYIPRRDKLHLAQKRMAKLTGVDAEEAWRNLAERLDTISMKDIPKFDDLYRAIRGATIVGAQTRILDTEIMEDLLNETRPIQVQ